MRKLYRDTPIRMILKFRWDKMDFNAELPSFRFPNFFQAQILLCQRENSTSFPMSTLNLKLEHSRAAFTVSMKIIFYNKIVV